MSTIAELFDLRPIRSVRVLKRESKWLDRDISIPFTGIELELEGFTRNIFDMPNTLWTVVRDDSLRNGGEIVTVVLDGGRLTKFIEAIRKMYKEVKFKNSHRCSTHVHINMHDKDITFVRNFMAVYATLEDVLFSFVDPSRVGNNYCYSVTHLDPNMDFLVGGGFERDLKYCALNPAPLRTYGTVEFRHLEGLDDPEKLVKWLAIIYRIFTYVENTRSEVIRETLFSLNTTSLYLDYMQRIFREDISNFGEQDWHQRLAQNITWAKLALI